MTTLKCQFPLWNDDETEHHICGEEPTRPWGYYGHSMRYCKKHITERVAQHKENLTRDYLRDIADLQERYQQALAAFQEGVTEDVKDS